MSIVQTDSSISDLGSSDESFVLPVAVSQADDEKLEKLEKMREEVDWENILERRSFFDQFRQLSVGWKHHLPDLREFFKREEMEWMLTQCVPEAFGQNAKNAVPFVCFVVRTGYKDDPPLDESGEPLVRRNTPVHTAYWHPKRTKKLTRELFKIYDNFYVNYVSDLGITHFHTACRMGYYDVVQEFLAFHQNPNGLMKCVGNITYTPLYLASKNEDGKEVIKLLLEYGADPTLPSDKGNTPLHVICSRNFSDEHRFGMLKTLLDRCALKHFPKNEQGITLQLALLKRLPIMVARLVDYGALSTFVFPSEKKFNESVTIAQVRNPWYRLEVASSTLATVERLEKKGYNLNRSDAMTVMKFLINRLGYKSKEDQKEKNYEFWRYSTSFTSVAKTTKITNDELSPTLYDLTRSPPSEPKEPLTYEDYLKLSRSPRLRLLSLQVSEACTRNLFEKMSAGFFRQWTLGPLMKKTDQRHSKLDCMNVFKAMKCQDLLQRYGVNTLHKELEEFKIFVFL